MMSDLIRMVRQLYPHYDAMLQEASDIKNEYIQQGGNPRDVISPERLAAFEEGGPEQVMDTPPAVRPDGSVAAPYVPTEVALANNLIEPAAVPAVLAALQDGVNTVSSGVDGGCGFAVGRDPSGNVVKVMR